MPDNLEFPGLEESPDWGALYRARGDEVQANRPVFTGDIYTNIKVQSLQAVKNKSILVLQHPCALRTDGVNLHSRLLVAEVHQHPVIASDAWRGHLSKMPLPELMPSLSSGRRHQAAFFDDLYLVSPADLEPERRIACMSQVGVNLLLQRWVMHSSRVVIPTWRYQSVTGSVFEEADLIEEWCEERLDSGIPTVESANEAMKWLRQDRGDGTTQQQRLEDPQQRSAVRKDMRAELKRLRVSGA